MRNKAYRRFTESLTLKRRKVIVNKIIIGCQMNGG